MTDQDPEDIKVSADANPEAEPQVTPAEQAEPQEAEDNQLGDLMAKPGAAKGQAGHYRSHRYVQDGGRFRVGQAFNAHQQDDGPLFLRQFAQCTFQIP